MSGDAKNEHDCEAGIVSLVWWSRVQQFLEYRKRVGMTPADANCVWMIPALYGLNGSRRRSIKQIAAKTAFTEAEIAAMRSYIEDLIRICVPINVKM